MGDTYLEVRFVVYVDVCFFLRWFRRVSFSKNEFRVVLSSIISKWFPIIFGHNIRETRIAS